MYHALGHMVWTMALIYLDIIVYGHTSEKHRTGLTQVRNAFCKANLKLKSDKYYFGYAEATYLGHVVSKEGLRQDPEKKRALEEYSTPSTPKDLCSFL